VEASVGALKRVGVGRDSGHHCREETLTLTIRIHPDIASALPVSRGGRISTDFPRGPDPIHYEPQNLTVHTLRGPTNVQNV